LSETSDDERVAAATAIVDKNGTTPLHRAVRNRCASAVNALLDLGADPDATNQSGSTALQLACWTTGRGGAGRRPRGHSNRRSSDSCKPPVVALSSSRGNVTREAVGSGCPAPVFASPASATPTTISFASGAQAADRRDENACDPATQETGSGLVRSGLSTPRTSTSESPASVGSWASSSG